MKFIIRDDDLNYFSTPTDILRWYGDIFAEGIPVSFAAIPYVKPVSDVYTSTAQKEDIEYPISANAALVSYVTSNPLIEIIQHGCTHETKDGIFEYRRHEGLFEETRRGKAELERAFDRPITVFAPPHDWIGNHGVRAIEAARLHIIRGRGTGVRNVIARLHYVKIFFKMFWFKLRHFLLRRHIPAYPYVLDFGLHKELCSYRLEDADVFDGLAYAHQKGGIFVVVTHLHFYTDKKKTHLRELIAKAREYGADFISPSVAFRDILQP